MGVRVILNKEEDIVRPARPEELKPKKPKVGFSVSQPKRKGPILTRTGTLKGDILSTMLSGGEWTPSFLARYFGATEESVKATIRDLRKDGWDVALIRDDYNGNAYQLKDAA